MSRFSEETLRKLNKVELIVIIQEQDVMHEKHKEHMENLVAEVRKLTSSFAKLKPELAISKNITTVLSGRLVQMERQCWANAQCSRRESVEIVGIPSSVHQNQLEDSVCKIFDKLNCNIVKDNLENCQRLKGDRVIVKFSKRKECKQVLIVKVTRKMLIWLILALREIVRFISIKVYVVTTKCCGHGAKSYTIWEEFTAGLCLVAQLK